MLNKKELTFVKGLRDGLPIALGYLSVSFTFGIIAIAHNMPIWAPILTSLTNFTGTGQFVGMNMFYNGSAFFEIAITMLVISARYILLSLSLSQKLPENTNTLKRFIIAFGITDEVFAVAINKREQINFQYLLGLMLGSFSGWVGGTCIGALAGKIVPDSLLSAMGIAIYAMFMAIIVPPAKGSRPILITIIISAAISSFLYIFKPFRDNSFYLIIIGGVGSALITTFVFPIKDVENGKDAENDVKTEESVSSDSDIPSFNGDSVSDEITTEMIEGSEDVCSPLFQANDTLSKAGEITTESEESDSDGEAKQ